MLFGNDELDLARRRIASGAMDWGADEIKWALDLAKAARPPAYDNWQRGVRARYEGKQDAYLQAALKQRYPQTWERMPRAPLNWLRLIASQDAGVYSHGADREVVGDEARTDLLAELCESASLGLVMVEAERRLAAARTLFLRVTWRKLDAKDDGVPVVDLFWPSDVLAVCHPSMPSDFRACWLLMVSCASPEGPQDRTPWYEVWSRSWEADDLGAVTSWGPWHRHLVSTDGRASMAGNDARAQYPGALPWVCVQASTPTGSVFVDDDHDVVHSVDALNVSRANETYTMDLQGHTPVVYAGNSIESAEIVIGPDRISKIGGGETLQTLALDPKLQDMRDSRTLSMRELAVTRRNSADAYSVETGPPLSGVSRMIANEPHRQMLREQEQVWKRVEEQQILPVLADVHDLFGPGPDIGADAAFAVSFREAGEVEEPETRDRRLTAAVDSGWISPAAAAVAAGYYGDVAAAVEAGLSDKVKGSQPSPIDNAIADMMARTPEPADDAEDDEPAAAVNDGATGGETMVDPAAAPVADAALNGAQVSSLLEIVDRVAAKGLPVETARALIVAAFPLIEVATIDRIMGPMRGFTLPSVPTDGG